MKNYLRQFFYSFPIQLLLLHFRKNLLMLLIWVFLAVGITGHLGVSLGLNYLFISPEYRGEVDVVSFFLVGLGYGVFVMCWHLTVYLLYSARFYFLARLKRPFLVFCINNSILPLVFFILYVSQQIKFGTYFEMKTVYEYWDTVVGFASGVVLVLFILSFHFVFTNRVISNFFLNRRNNIQKLIEVADEKNWKELEYIRNWRIDSFLNENFRFRYVNDLVDSNRILRKMLLQQNHYNALLLQVSIVLIFLVLGIKFNVSSFSLPAAANIFLLFSIVISALGAISFWLDRWQFVVIMGLLLIVNVITKLDYYNETSKAYGLDFKITPAKYRVDSLRAMCSEVNVAKDKVLTKNILERWRQKNSPELLAMSHELPIESRAHSSRLIAHSSSKPHLFIVCVSGGGLKATVWAMRVLQKADSLTGGKFSEHTALITGASGGMIGAAYYRELLLRKKQGENIDLYGTQPLNDVSKDLLNAVSFSVLTNDLFLPRSNYAMGELRYRKDRGFAFERQFHENTHYQLNKLLSDYAMPERTAQIPMLFITPSVLNDGRLMIISPQPVSYMMGENVGENMLEADFPDAVDFGTMFKQQRAGDLRFSTALRANATFPFILPNIQLPTEPAIELVDAGFRDNVGSKSALRFIHTFGDWINANTSGVTLVVIRSYDPKLRQPNSTQGGLLSNLFNPLSFAGNYLFLQEYEYQNDFSLLRDRYEIKNLNVLNFNYTPSEKLRDSPTSFHLTKWERANILASDELEANKSAFKALEELLK